jgi:hypothetical protein
MPRKARRCNWRKNFGKEVSKTGDPAENPAMRRLLAVGAAFVMVVALPRARGAIMQYPPTDSVPVDRLITNTGKYVKAHPHDSEGYFLLGRLHSLAYSGIPRLVDVWRWSRGYDPASSLPAVAFLEPVPRPERYANENTLPEKAREHLIEALRNYSRATELKPRQALAYVGSGWMLEQGALFAPDIDAPFVDPPRPVSAGEWRAQALAAYRFLAAHYVTLVSANAGAGAPRQLLWEASLGILRLLPGPNLSAEEKTETDRARQAVESFQHDPANHQQIISPIIFPLRGAASLEALLDPRRVVSFDLAGNGVPAQWPWVNANAGFLVWDPEKRGHIDSGRQLFGSVTWWMFWRDGYQALAALDDDGNGWLEGNELAGIAVWRDVNGNGVCDAGEVISLLDAGVVRIAVSATGSTSGMPFNARGVEMSEGSFRPTYDWTPTSVAPKTDVVGKRAR